MRRYWPKKEKKKIRGKKKHLILTGGVCVQNPMRFENDYLVK